ncbi:MAG TPA: nucleotidyltransferase family protein [Gaiellaceae bacterium]|nr:nucleotidyltransferase family protein [Gaiellaceae bacterium]
MISAVVLAAGAATRFGSPKQLLLLPYVLEGLQAAQVDEVVIVSGAYPIEESESLSLDGARVVACPEWALGPGASLRCGLAALGEEVEAAVVVLADGPYLDPRAIERVLAHRDQSDFVAATYDGVRSHPAVLSRAVWAEIPDDGGRGLPVLLIACEDLVPPGDIDTPDLARDL